VKPKDLKSLLKGKLSKKDFSFLKRSYDAIGSVAILEIDDELRKKQKVIAQALLDANKSIKTVLRKADKHTGKFRTQKMTWLAGVKTREALHKENGISLKLDVEKVYFSPRMASERKRIADNVKPGEDILVMFSGCAPYPCVIARNAKPKRIVGVEINPVGHKYGLENVKLNKLKNVELLKGDVKKVVPLLKEKFDRIIMPAPRDADAFLNVALKKAKKGTIIHLYTFLHEDDFYMADEMVDAACSKSKVKWKKIALVKCGQHKPRTFRVCLDFRVL